MRACAIVGPQLHVGLVWFCVRSELSSLVAVAGLLPPRIRTFGGFMRAP